MFFRFDLHLLSNWVWFCSVCHEIQWGFYTILKLRYYHAVVRVLYYTYITTFYFLITFLGNPVQLVQLEHCPHVYYGHSYNSILKRICFHTNWKGKLKIWNTRPIALKQKACKYCKKCSEQANDANKLDKRT